MAPRTNARTQSDALVFEARLARARARLATLRAEPNTQWRLWEHAGYFVPYVRVGRERDTVRAERYRDSQAALAWSAKAAWGNAAPLSSREVEVFALIVRRSRRGDSDNLMKAILDAIKGIVYNDDRQVSFQACKVVRPPFQSVSGDYAEVWIGNPTK